MFWKAREIHVSVTWPGVQDALDRIEAKLDALIMQGPALEALKAQVQRVRARLEGSGADLTAATVANQPSP